MESSFELDRGNSRMHCALIVVEHIVDETIDIFLVQSTIAFIPWACTFDSASTFLGIFAPLKGSATEFSVEVSVVIHGVPRSSESRAPNGVITQCTFRSVHKNDKNDGGALFVKVVVDELQRLARIVARCRAKFDAAFNDHWW